MQAKLKEITGILKEKRRGYEQARKLPVTAVPQFGQIKVGRIAFLSARAGPKTARDALQTLLGELFGNGQRSNAPRHCLHYTIESVDFDDLRIKTGLQLKVTLVRSNQTDVDSPHRWYAVEASIADANLPLGAALKQHQEAIEARAQDLQVKTSLALMLCSNADCKLKLPMSESKSQSSPSYPIYWQVEWNRSSFLRCASRIPNALNAPLLLASH